MHESCTIQLLACVASLLAAEILFIGLRIINFRNFVVINAFLLFVQVSRQVEPGYLPEISFEFLE